jgi:hypothetical protein
MTRSAGSEPDAPRDVLSFGPLLLLLLPFVTFGRFALGDELANADVFLAYRPAHALLAEGLRRGEVPLWTSAFSGGFPLAFSEYGWFSPLVWVPLLVAGSHSGYYLAVAFHVALAALATYGLARTWDASRTEATISGLIFSHSLLVIGGAPLLNQAGSYWVAPALLWVVARTLDWHPLAPPLGGIIVALGLLGGHPQVTIVAALPAISWAGVALIRSREVARRFALLVLLGATCTGVGVASVRILPTLTLLESSVRQGGLSEAARALGSAHPFDLIAGFFFPSLQLTRVLSPHWAAYLGPLPLGLAIFAVMRWRRLADRVAARSVPATLARRNTDGKATTASPNQEPRSTRTTALDGSGVSRDRSAVPMSGGTVSRIPWLGGLAVAGIVLGVGQHVTVTSWLGAAPVISLFRDPSRFLLWTVTAVALIAPLGMRLAIGEAREYRRPVRPARALRRGLRDRFRLRGRFGAANAGDGPVGTTWWFGLACGVTLLFAVASWAFVTQEPLLRPLAEARVDVGARVLGAAIDPRGDYPPEFYRARFEAGWRRVGEAIDVRDPAVAAPLLALIGAGWWWAWGRGRSDATALAGILSFAPLAVYGQVRLPAVSSTDVALARESTFEAISKVAATTSGDEPARFLSWLPLATDFGLRTQSVARRDTDAETDAISYQFLVRMLAPNLAMGIAIDAGDRDVRVARLASVDGYENLLTREQAVLASAIGSERSPSTAGDGGLSLAHVGLRGRREAIARRWGVLAASGVTAIVTATTHAPVDAPRGVVIDAGIMPPAGLAPSVDLHRLARPWPRIFATTGWDVVRTADDAVRREELFDPIEAPRAVLTVAPGTELVAGAATPLAVPVRVTRDDGDAITVFMDAPGPTVLVILDALTPGWSATIDGKRAPIVPANVAFRGVIVPPGLHEVSMTYVPDRWATARALTAISLVVLAAWLLNVGTRGR